MSHSAATRDRARELFVQDGWTYQRISAETGVAKTTLISWSRREDWGELRDIEAEVRTRSRELLAKTMEMAAESGDPQQVYAAMQAAKLMGRLDGTADRYATPKAVAVILLDQLGKHAVIGPVVKRFRNEVIRLVLEEVKRLEPEDGST